MKRTRIQTRNSQEPERLLRRAAAMPGKPGPATLDPDARSVEVVATTEQPVRVWDWERGEIDEVLLMSGLQPVDRAPVLDAHDRWSTRNIAGSFRDMRVDGDRLMGRIYFSSRDLGEQCFGLVQEGHLTDVSVGYSVEECQWVGEGETASIQGKEYQGPIKVATKWRLHELSLCPVGADDAAKVRAAHKPEQKERTMDPRLREYLEARGLAKDANEKDAWACLATLREQDAQARGHHREAEGEPSEAAQAGEPDPPSEAEAPAAASEAVEEPQDPADAAAAERRRAADILGMARMAGLEAQAVELITSERSADQVGRYILEQMAQARGGAGYRPPARIEADERDRFRAAAVDSLLVRGGVSVERPAQGHDELMGLSLRELARESLRRAGVRPPGDVRDMVGRALTTSDLPYVLGETTDRSVAVGFDEAPETWQQWCAVGATSDFRPGRAVRLGEIDGLEEMGQDDEYKYANLKDAQETYQIATYGKAIRISRQAVINDDLNLITSIPRRMGEAAARTVGDVAWAALTANAAMGDSKALFHEDHNNMVGVAALDVDGVGAAVQAMMSQTDLSGKRRIRVLPTFFLAPTDLLVTAEKFFGSEFIGTQAEPNIRNPFSGTFTRERRIYEPRLSEDDPAVFYIAGPKGRTVTVFFLNGVQRPFIETAQDWNTDGTRVKVRIDVGAKALDWRGLVQAEITG